ncbi:DUF6463 family protein [Mycolicibacterium brisbanense]|uniref:Transmembrane protein n=1 Tax=Mycolicibacterium brisbanense TaxID=146020 RepID=A0A117I5P1_9MYCO|nr:DUF6463 family protein [Mycolicibacterium brisbanense]MCV7158948.1 hypothetical protein [Mycolicibacterium brisbanense]GAS88802.1 uncharacterized protein, precursor [Mycolicibacterium brisbanense]
MNNRNITAWGGRLAVAGGGFHVAAAAVKRRAVWSQVLDEGVANTVTLDPPPDRVAVAEAFWFSPGSFGVPLGLIGQLVLHMTRRGHPVPAWLGWVIVAWAGLLGVMVPKSGAWAIMTVGALIIAGESGRDRKALAAKA